MTEEKKELFKYYIQSNVAPILIDFIDGESIPNSAVFEDNYTVLPANCKIEELNGHYENTNFVKPEWLKKLEASTTKILVIDKLDTISKKEQEKFIEILEYKQVSTFKLPKNTIIIITADKITKETINEEIYSLVAHIKG